MHRGHDGKRTGGMVSIGGRNPDGARMVFTRQFGQCRREPRRRAIIENVEIIVGIVQTAVLGWRRQVIEICADTACVARADDGRVPERIHADRTPIDVVARREK